MRIWFDTEFIEDGRTIELLSIGLVREDGLEYYAEPREAERARSSAWVRDNVLPHLTGPVKRRSLIAKEIVQFVGTAPQFWAWYGAYDWVVLCQLYGTMMDLPQGWPMHVMDYKQTCTETRSRLIQPDFMRHHALDDARWLARVMRGSAS